MEPLSAEERELLDDREASLLPIAFSLAARGGVAALVANFVAALLAVLFRRSVDFAALPVHRANRR